MNPSSFSQLLASVNKRRVLCTLTSAAFASPTSAISCDPLTHLLANFALFDAPAAVVQWFSLRLRFDMQNPSNTQNLPLKNIKLTHKTNKSQPNKENK